MLKSRIPIRDNYKVTKPPAERRSNSKIKVKEISRKIKPLSEHEIKVIVFDDILGSSNSKHIDQFFKKGRHKKIDMYYLT